MAAPVQASAPANAEEVVVTSTVETSQANDALAAAPEDVPNDAAAMRTLAEQHKSRADDLYRRKLYAEAQSEYLDAIAVLPPRPGSQSPPETAPEPRLSAESGGTSNDETKHKGFEGSANDSAPEDTTQASSEDPRIRHLRAVLHANLSAAALGLKQWSDAADAATEALHDEPDYVKALYRRATANTALGTIQALLSAACDYDRLIALPDQPPMVTPASKTDWRQARDTVQARAEKMGQEESERIKNEGLAMLDDVANKFLNVFGMSTRDFGVQKQEGGGFSINMNRGG